MVQYAYGNGCVGCLFDHTSGPYDDLESAADGAADNLELTEAEREELAADGCLYLDGDRAAEVGAQVVEIFEVDEDWQAEF